MNSDLIDAYLQHLTWRNYSPNTVTQRRRALARFARRTSTPVDDATSADLMRYLARFKHPATKTAERAHLAGYYRWLVIHGHRDDDPVLRVPTPKLPRWLPHPIPETDLMRALRDAPDRVSPWLYLAAFAGLRACEIAPLRGEDLWWHTDPALLIVRRAKGGDEQAVPIAPVLETELRLLAGHGPLFTRRDGQPGSVPAHLVSHHANRYLHSIGIWHTLHSLRHRFGTQVYRASGRDLRQTQELMRHRSVVSTTVYTAVDGTEGAAIVGALPC